MNLLILAQSIPLDPAPVNTFISRLQPSDLIAFSIFGIGGLIALVAIISAQWRLHKRTELEIGLKQEMIARGMSAEEIERVIKAGRPNDGCGY